MKALREKISYQMDTQQIGVMQLKGRIRGTQSSLVEWDKLEQKK